MRRASRSSSRAIDSLRRWYAASLVRIASGDILASSSLNLRAIDFPLLTELFEMAVVDLVRHGDEGVIPSVIPCFVSAEEEHRGSPRIECVHYTIRSPGMLDSQLPHVIVPGGLDTGTVRVLECHTVFFKQFHVCAHTRLLLCCQMVPPVPELIGELYITCHPVHIMPSMACSGQVG